MRRAAAAWALVAVPSCAMAGASLGAGGHAARDFRVAAGRLRELVQEMKAATVEEEQEGRSPDIDSAVADFARASLEATRQAEQVVSSVRRQPQHAAVKLRAASSGGSQASVATAAAAVEQKTRRRTSEEGLMPKSIQSENAARLEKLKQLTASAEQMIKSHMKQMHQENHTLKDGTAKEEKEDEDDKEMEAVRKRAGDMIRRHNLRQATAAAEGAIREHMEQRRKGSMKGVEAAAPAQLIPSSPNLERHVHGQKVEIDQDLQDVIDSTASGKLCGLGGPCIDSSSSIDGSDILLTDARTSASEDSDFDEDANESPLSKPIFTPPGVPL